MCYVTEREIESMWESENEMIVRLREWEGDWESESDERVRLFFATDERVRLSGSKIEKLF